VPGIVDSAGEKIIATPNIDLAGFPIYQSLKNDLKIPIVAIGNDVNVGLLGEKWLGAGKKYNNIIGLFPGTGIGGAIIINGRLYPGSNGAAGEMGHITMDRNGPECSCGNRGCLEALASRWAIERDIKAEIKKGRKTLLTKGSRGVPQQIKSKILRKALERKDKLTLSVMTKASQVLGEACVSLRHIFDPQVIILGGGVIEACGDFVIPMIKKTLHDDPFFEHLPSCDVVISELGDDAVLLGAIALVRDKMLFQPDEPGVHYPHLQYVNAKRIAVENRPMQRSFFIRGDGAKKMIDDFMEFNEFKQSHVLTLDMVKMICRKGARILIIASPSKRLDLTEEGKIYLNDKMIKAKILPLKEAASLYNTIPKQKALFVHLPR